MDICNANSYEMGAILFLGALDGQIKSDESVLEKRLRSIPDAWRQYRIARTSIDKVLGYLYDSLPQKQLKHIYNNVRTSTIQFKPKGINGTNDSICVDEDILRLLINETMSSRCAICLASPSEEKACPLRKALCVIAPPDDIQSDGGCPYSEVTKRNELGGYI